MNLTGNFLVLCTNMKVIYIIIHRGWSLACKFMKERVNVSNISFHELNMPVELCYKCYKYCFYHIFPNVHNTKMYRDIICNNSLTFK